MSAPIQSIEVRALLRPSHPVYQGPYQVLDSDIFNQIVDLELIRELIEAISTVILLSTLTTG